MMRSDGIMMTWLLSPLPSVRLRSPDVYELARFCDASAKAKYNLLQEGASLLFCRGDGGRCPYILSYLGHIAEGAQKTRRAPGLGDTAVVAYIWRRSAWP